MAMAAPVTWTARTVIDADGYPAARPRRADQQGHANSFEPSSPEAARPLERQERPVAVLAFPRRPADRFADDAETAGGRAYRSAWRDAGGAPLPTSAFLAQHIAQERLTGGLTLDPHAAATGAYARSGKLVAPNPGPLVSLTI
jgi:hypothetical protein